MATAQILAGTRVARKILILGKLSDCYSDVKELILWRLLDRWWGSKSRKLIGPKKAPVPPAVEVG